MNCKVAKRDLHNCLPSPAAQHTEAGEDLPRLHTSLLGQGVGEKFIGQVCPNTTVVQGSDFQEQWMFCGFCATGTSLTR